ncbi:MAG: hypothetical protein HRU19_16795 [Pseudobacteriovorax sp.]|nr:hypothetical protein [Pseudobacteriovorax sp.]
MKVVGIIVALVSGLSGFAQNQSRPIYSVSPCECSYSHPAAPAHCSFQVLRDDIVIETSDSFDQYYQCVVARDEVVRSL